MRVFNVPPLFAKVRLGGYGLAALWGQTLPDLLAALADPASWDCALSICMFSAFPAFDGQAVFCEKWPPALYFGKVCWGCRACHDKRGPFFRKMESRPAAKRKGERNNKKEAPSQGLPKPEEHRFWIHKHSFFQIRLKTLQWIAAKTMA